MHDILRDMMFWLGGFVVVSATTLIAARAIANAFQKRAMARAQAGDNSTARRTR